MGPHFAIITVPANALVSRIHDRMPAILAPDETVLVGSAAGTVAPTAGRSVRPAAAVNRLT
jgi:hypothetical protein